MRLHSTPRAHILFCAAEENTCKVMCCEKDGAAAVAENTSLLLAPMHTTHTRLRARIEFPLN